MRNLLAVIIVAILILPGAALASSVVRTGDTVQITADQAVEGDFYALGSTIAISGNVAEDLLLMGGTVTLNGEVGADVAALGGSVSFHGIAKDDVRIVGGKVTIAGEVAGNLVVVASELEVLSTAKIAGDLLFFGDKADVAGFVGGDILGTSNQLRVDGIVEGGIDVKSVTLVLGERASVTENVSYISNLELTRAQNASIGGEIIKTDTPPVPDDTLRIILIPFLVTLFAALVWYLLFKQFIGKVVAGTNLHPLRSSLLGFALIFLTPIAAVILLASTLGAIIGITLFAVYFVLIFAGITLVGVVTGAFLAKFISKTEVSPIIYIIGGVAVMHALVYVPIIGPVVLLGLFLITLGSVAERLYAFLRSS